MTGYKRVCIDCAKTRATHPTTPKKAVKGQRCNPCWKTLKASEV